MLNSATIQGFVSELGFIKEALSLAQLQSAGGKAIGKRMGPAGALPASKTTFRGQTVPGLAKVQKDYASVQQANDQLQGARSLL